MGEKRSAWSQLGSNAVCVVWNGKADGASGFEVAFAVVGDHENRPTDMTNIVVVRRTEDDSVATQI